MKRVMMLVFPTPWSPRNTSLYFASGAMDGSRFGPWQNKALAHRVSPPHSRHSPRAHAPTRRSTPPRPLLCPRSRRQPSAACPQPPTPPRTRRLRHTQTHARGGGGKRPREPLPHAHRACARLTWPREAHLVLESAALHAAHLRHLAHGCARDGGTTHGVSPCTRIRRVSRGGAAATARRGGARPWHVDGKGAAAQGSPREPPGAPLPCQVAARRVPGRAAKALRGEGTARAGRPGAQRRHTPSTPEAALKATRCPTENDSSAILGGAARASRWMNSHQGVVGSRAPVPRPCAGSPAATRALKWPLVTVTWPAPHTPADAPRKAFQDRLDLSLLFRQNTRLNGCQTDTMPPTRRRNCELCLELGPRAPCATLARNFACLLVVLSCARKYWRQAERDDAEWRWCSEPCRAWPLRGGCRCTWEPFAAQVPV